MGAKARPYTQVIYSATQTPFASSASEDFHPFARRAAALRRSLARLLSGQRAVLDGVRVVAVGAAQRAGVRAQDGAQHPAVRRLQDVGAVNLLRRAVIPTEDAHLRLRLAPLGQFAPPVRGEQVEAGEAAPVRGRVSASRRRVAGQVLVGPQQRDALPQVVDGDRRGARGRAAAVQVCVAVPDYAGAHRRVVLQAQRRFQGLRDGVGSAGRAVDLVFGDQCRQPEVVVPKIESVVVGRARVQVAAV